VGGLGFGFLKGQEQSQPEAFAIICGTSRKRLAEEPSAGTSKKKKLSDPRPIIDMMVHQDGKTHQLRALLDTGCSVALINKRTVEKRGIKTKRHQHPRGIENYTGEKVEGAGQYFTKPLLLQHRRHYSWERFEVTPMDPEIDIFLPFSWIAKHPPQGAWTTEEVRFNSQRCLNECTKFEQSAFSLTWDESVSWDPDAQTIGYVAAITPEAPNVPLKFREYLNIMGKEAADSLPEHKPYDCKIDLQEGSTAP